MTDIINSSLQNGKFPDKLIYAAVFASFEKTNLPLEDKITSQSQI